MNLSIKMTQRFNMKANDVYQSDVNADRGRGWSWNECLSPSAVELTGLSKVSSYICLTK